MKYLKYLIGIVLFLILFFFAKGLLTPSISYQSEVVVNKPVKESWAVMSDETKLPQWIKGYKKSELISGTVNTKGAVSNVYVEDNGKEMVMEETINEVIPNKLLSMTFTMDFMTMDYEMHMSENNGKTTIKTKGTTKGNSLFSKSMVSFMGSTMKAQEDENLQDLKKVIEENTKDYFQKNEVINTPHAQ